MSISAGVVRAVALQQIDHAPHAKASAEGNHKGLQSGDGRSEKLHILSYREYVRPAELHSRSAEKNCLTENVSSLRSVKGATLPCDACASIPCGLAVRKQHEMLFAASKFGKINTENQTVDWSQCAKS